MNKLIVDVATDEEQKYIISNMERIIKTIDSDDKKFVFYKDTPIHVVRDVNSNYFITRVCSGQARGYEGWHNQVYLIHGEDGELNLEYVRQDAYGPSPYPKNEELEKCNRENAALNLYYGNFCAWRAEEKRNIKSCSYKEK